MTEITGISIDGKMSVGVLSRMNGLSRMSTRAATTKVYGRRRARRTIHMGLRSRDVPGKGRQLVMQGSRKREVSG